MLPCLPAAAPEAELTPRLGWVGGVQVKNFGRRGRTKWTHLVAEDTTNFESPWCVHHTACRAHARREAEDMSSSLSD